MHHEESFNHEKQITTFIASSNMSKFYVYSIINSLSLNLVLLWWTSWMQSCKCFINLSYLYNSSFFTLELHLYLMNTLNAAMFKFNHVEVLLIFLKLHNSNFFMLECNLYLMNTLNTTMFKFNHVKVLLIFLKLLTCNFFKLEHNFHLMNILNAIMLKFF